MKYENEEYRARYGSALLAAQNLATLLCVEVKDEPALLPPALRAGLNAPAGNLVLVPYVSFLNDAQFMEAVRETRSTALIIESGDTMSGSATYYIDRKSTRLNSSHVKISYAVFCLKKKNLHATIMTLL